MRRCRPWQRLPDLASPGPATPPKAGPGPATPPSAGPGPATPPKPAVPASGTAGAVTYLGSERGTRARIARLILENGPVTAAALSTRLGLTPAAVRRHLDNLLAGGLIEVRTARRMASSGRGRPAKLFAITDAGRSAFEHAYDDLATSALRFLAEVAGPEAVAEFARRQVAELERRYGPAMESAAGEQGQPRSPRRCPPTVTRPRRPVPPRWRPAAGNSPAGSSSASTIARSRTSRPSSRSCARRRPKRSPGCSVPRCSAWPLSRMATGSAPRM